MLKKIVVGISSVWLLTESGFGLLQVLGREASGHALFAMTGHFANPGPFGGFIAMLMAICGAYFVLYHKEHKGWERWLWYLSFVAFTAGVLVLPASMSRAGWLGLATAGIILLLRNQNIKDILHKKPWIWSIASATLLIVCIGGFLLKKESALGRIHIWRIESRIIAKNPLKGVGSEHMAFSYGEEQAAFFSEKPRYPLTRRIAGCPEYAFNEYLKAGMSYGFAGLLAAIALSFIVCLTLLRRNNPLGYGAVVLAVFSVFSYPLSLWQFQIFALLFIAAATGEWLGKREWISYVAFLMVAISAYTCQKHTHSDQDFRDLYSRGHLLFESGQYRDAISILREGAGMSCDPMFHNIIGRCHEALGETGQAEAEYLHAHYMVPGRIYPLVLLQELYLSENDTAKAREIMSLIREIPINDRNRNMARLRKRAEENLGGTND